jgi:excisionase family DNA binding protein
MPVIRRKLSTAPVKQPVVGTWQPDDSQRLMNVNQPAVGIWRPDDSQRLMNVKQAAKYLGLASPWHIRQMFRSGTLKPIRIGRRDMVDRADIDAWIEKAKGR